MFMSNLWTTFEVKSSRLHFLIMLDRECTITSEQMVLQLSSNLVELWSTWSATNGKHYASELRRSKVVVTRPQKFQIKMSHN